MRRAEASVKEACQEKADDKEADWWCGAAWVARLLKGLIQSD